MNLGWCAAALLASLSACSGGHLAGGSRQDASSGDASGHGVDANPPGDAAQPDVCVDSDAATAPVLASIVVTPVDESVCVGSPPIQYKAVASYSDGTTSDVTGRATWSSSVATIITIDPATGLTGSPQHAGTTTIAATLGAVAGTTSLTVAACGLQSIAVTPANPTLDVGCTAQMKASASYSDGSVQDVTLMATWSSGSTATATVDLQGYVTCLAAGTTTVSATLMAVTGKTTVTCAAGNILSVSVSPASAAIATGATQSFTASGTSTSGATCNLSMSASWQSSNPGVATIGAGSPIGAVATGVDAGDATITASYGAHSGSAALTVQ